MTGDEDSLAGSTDPKRPWPQFRLWMLLLLVGLSACLFSLWKVLTAEPSTRVSGVVRHNGLPLGSGVIVFEPAGPNGSKTSALVVRGRYAIDTGMLPGKYTVGVQDSSKAIPGKYDSPKTSGLSATIRDARSNTLDLDLR